MDIETLEHEERRLILPRFTEEDALTLGAILLRLAREDTLPVVIDIRSISCILLLLFLFWFR